MTNEMNRLRVSLADAIENWLNNTVPDTSGWDDLDIPQADKTAKIMADTAFNILLAMQDMKEYQFQNDMLRED